MYVMVLDECPFQSATLIADELINPQVILLERLVSFVSAANGGLMITKTRPRLDATHPIVEWAQQCYQHWSWCALALRALYREISVRFGKIVSQAEVLNAGLARGQLIGPQHVDELWFSTHGVPRHLKSSDPVNSWRRFLAEVLDANNELTWSFRGRPEWNLKVQVPVMAHIG